MVGDFLIRINMDNNNSLVMNRIMTLLLAIFIAFIILSVMNPDSFSFTKFFISLLAIPCVNFIIAMISSKDSNNNEQ